MISWYPIQNTVSESSDIHFLRLNMKIWSKAGHEFDSSETILLFFWRQKMQDEFGRRNNNSYVLFNLIISRYYKYTTED